MRRSLALPIAVALSFAAAPAAANEPAMGTAGATTSAPDRSRVTREPESASVPIAGQDSDALDALDEVVISAEQREPAAVQLTRSEARVLPGAFGDPFRAIEVLPGVTPIVSGLPYFFVRGAPPGNVGYFIDGVRVPSLYHVAFGPAVLPPALIERIDFFPGGQPAAFGRFAGAVVAASSSEPRGELHGELGLRLYDAGGVVETGFAGGRGSVLVGGRYSYTAALLSLLAEDLIVNYHDYQARVSYELTAEERVSVTAFGSYDLLGRSEGGVDYVDYGVEFHRALARYEHVSGAGSLRAALSLGYDRADASLISGSARLVSDRSAELRVDTEHQLGEGALLRSGGLGSVDAYALPRSPYADPDSPETLRFEQQFPARKDFGAAAFAELVLRLASGLELTPGARADLYVSGATREWSIDPRLAARLELLPSWHLLARLGLSHQAPAYNFPIAALAPALRGGLQRARQASLGMEIDVAGALQATLTGFYNSFDNLTDEVGTSGLENARLVETRPSGRAFGGELALRRRLTERVGAMLSYTLSRSTRTLGGVEAPSAYDRTHVANLALGVELGRGWRAGARALAYSGAPASGFIASDPNIAPAAPSGREPLFYRLDTRLEKRWTYSAERWIALVLEALNTTARSETNQQTTQTFLVPNIGLEGGF